MWSGKVGRTVILLATALLALVAWYADLPILDTAMRTAITFLAVLGVFALSPTRIITGKRDILFDILITVLAVGACGLDAVKASDLPFILLTSRVIMPAALGALLLSSVTLSRTRPPRQGGMAWALRVREQGLRYDIVCVLAVLLLCTAVLRPLLLFTIAIASAPWLVALCAAVAAFIAWRGLPYAAHYPALTSPDGVILALAGAVCARFALECVPRVLLEMPHLIQESAIASTTAMLSAAGLILISVLPLVMWRSLLLLRSSHDQRHVPDWSPAIVGGCIGLLIMALLAPIAHPTWSMSGAGIDLGLQMPDASLSTTPLLISLACALLCGLAGFFSDRTRRILMAVPFLVGVLAISGFAICAFLSAFLSGGAGVVLALANGWYPLLVAHLLLLAAESLALILGLCGFVYEIARD